MQTNLLCQEILAELKYKFILIIVVFRFYFFLGPHEIQVLGQIDSWELQGWPVWPYLACPIVINTQLFIHSRNGTILKIQPQTARYQKKKPNSLFLGAKFSLNQEM